MWYQKSVLLVTFSLLARVINAQLSGSVGPSTSAANKASIKVCNVLNYGAKADGNTDIGPPLVSAWEDCKSGGLVYIPPGSYAMSTWAQLSHGSKIAIQLDGIITRTGTDGGNMIAISNTNDFEFFSGTSKGAMQGHGYEYISKGTYGARFIRFTDVTDFSLHGIALVDSASYYLVFDTCSNGEIYNMILRGIQIGMTDGIDIWGTNIWVHDVEVTNGDECVTVKSPSKNILVESVHCNISGGCAMGSLGLDTSVSQVHYRNIYENGAGGHYIKSYGGTGTVSNCLFENFIIHGSAYTLTNNEYWNHDSGGTGILVRDITYKNWKGTNYDNSRPVIRYQCADKAPCYGISLIDINLWTTDGNFVTWECQSAYGSGGCLRDASKGTTSYAASFTTVKTAPAYSAPTMPNDHASAFPSTKSFTIPPVPTSFFPGLKPSSALLSLTTNAGGGGGGGGTPATTTPPTNTDGGGSGGSCSALYGQCGGSGYTGPTCCSSGSCKYSNDWYSQCL